MLHGILQDAHNHVRGGIVRRVRTPGDIPDKRLQNNNGAGDSKVLPSFDCATSLYLFYEFVNVALAARCSHDKQLTAFVMDQLDEVATNWHPFQRSFGEETGLGSVWLATGWGIAGLVLAMSVIGEDVPVPLRDKITRLLEREIRLIMDEWSSETPPWFVWKQQYNSNQWALPLAGLALACTYLAEEKNRGAYELAVRGLAQTLAFHAESGDWTEGFHYGVLTCDVLFTAAFILKLGGDDRLAEMSFTKHFGNWITQMHMPGGSVINAYDSVIHWPLTTRGFLLATLLAEDGPSLWAEKNVLKPLPSDLISLLYLNHAAKLSKRSIVPPRHWMHFTAARIFVWRSGWDMRKDWALWARGGSPNDCHAHRDNGQISIYNGTDIILTEAGCMSYSTPGFEECFVLSSAHNVLQTKGLRTQMYTSPDDCAFPAAPRGVKNADNNGGHIMIDGAAAYDDVDVWNRSISWKKDRVVTIQDDVVMKEGHAKLQGEEWFRFHTGATGKIEIRRITDQSHIAAWDGVEIEFEATHPIVVEVILWPNAMHYRARCLVIKGVTAERSLGLCTIVRMKPCVTDCSTTSYAEYARTCQRTMSGRPKPSRFVLLRGEELIEKGIRMGPDRIMTAEYGVFYGANLIKEFEIAETGVYTLGLKYRSSRRAFRKILIDGAVLFDEMRAVELEPTIECALNGLTPSADHWRFKIIGEETEKGGYSLFLAKGRHSLSIMHERANCEIDAVLFFPKGQTVTLAALDSIDGLVKSSGGGHGGSSLTVSVL